MSSPSGALSPAPRAGIWSLLSASEMQALDRKTIETLGLPGEVLMESAGRALVEPALALWRSAARRGPIRAICGGGHNGGDGFVVVRQLHAEGIAAEAILVGDPERLPEDAALQWRRLAAFGAPHRVARDDEDWSRLLDETSVAIDGLFGTGLDRPIEGRRVGVIDALRCAHAGGLRVLAIDIPSGIAADTGAILGTAVEADATVTMGSPKLGLALEPGRSHAGEVTVARIGIADPEPERLPRIECWSRGAAAVRLPSRPRAAHKGSFGHVLVIAGSEGKSGAGALSVLGALRAGAGLVTLAHPEGLEVELGGLCVEAMSVRVATGRAGRFDDSSEKPLVELTGERDVAVLGPGFGRAPETGVLVRQLLTRIERPLVIDADGLFALGDELEALRDRGAPTVLTPHPGEAARLLGSDPAKVNADRVAAARTLTERSGAVVVLKGAATIVAEPEGRTLVTPTGGPLLASGGTGDVLTGLVAALLASGLEPLEAAGLAAWWHGAAADTLTVRRGADFGLRASELADALPEVAATLRQGVSQVESVASAAGHGEGLAAERGRLEGLALRFPGT
ncbi:MAG: NAD(P)H-hydrate dehydratase [bacterium]